MSRMLTPAPEIAFEIRSIMWGTLALTMARRGPPLRGMVISGKLTELWTVPFSK